MIWEKASTLHDYESMGAYNEKGVRAIPLDQERGVVEGEVVHRNIMKKSKRERLRESTVVKVYSMMAMTRWLTQTLARVTWCIHDGRLRL